MGNETSSNARFPELHGRMVWLEKNPETGIDLDLIEKSLFFYGLERSEKVRVMLIEAAAWHARQLPYAISLEANVASIRLRAKGRFSPPLARMTTNGDILDGSWPADSLLDREYGSKKSSGSEIPQAPERPDFNNISEAIYEAIAIPGRPVPLRPPPLAPIELVWLPGPDDISVLLCHVRFRGIDHAASVFRHEFSSTALATQPADVLVFDHPPDPPRAFVGPILDRRVAFLPPTAPAAFEMATNLLQVAEKAADGAIRRNGAIRQLADFFGDPDAIDTMRAIGWRRATAYLWLSSADNDKRKSLRRRQAAASFPSINAFLPSSTSSDHAYAAELTTIVDAGASLTEFLRERLGCSAATVATIAKAGGRLSSHHSHDVEKMASLLDAIPASRHPGRDHAESRIEDQWEAFEVVAFRFPASLISRISRNAAPPWFSPPVKDGAFGANSAIVADCLTSIIKMVVLPIIDSVPNDTLSALDDPRILDMLIGRRGWGALLELSHKWAAHASDIRAATGAGGGLSWPALTSEMSFGDLMIVPLTNRLDLESEGEALGHCASSYAGECAEGAIHMMSIRDPAGKPLSTAALIIHWDMEPEPFYELVQHRGRRNGPPTPEAEQALEKYINFLRSAQSNVNLEWHNERRQAILKERISEPNRASVGLVGYDYRSQDTRRAVFEAWKFFMPKETKNLDYSSVVSKISGPLAQ